MQKCGPKNASRTDSGRVRHLYFFRVADGHRCAVSRASFGELWIRGITVWANDHVCQYDRAGLCPVHRPGRATGGGSRYAHTIYRDR